MGTFKMKAMLALLAMALPSVGLLSCGGASGNTDTASQAFSAPTITNNAPGATTPRTRPVRSYLRSDGDKDPDDRQRRIRSVENDDLALLAAYGNKAGPADKQAISVLVKRYYMAVARGDGQTACSLLYGSLAISLAEGQRKSGRSFDETCAAAVSPLFKQQHQRLVADDVATMVVITVQTEGKRGLAALGFNVMPRGDILVKREDRKWKIDALFDSELP
jgi:hypothetical protein